MVRIPYNDPRGDHDEKDVDCRNRISVCLVVAGRDRRSRNRPDRGGDHGVADRENRTGTAGETISFVKSYKGDGTFILTVDNDEPLHGKWRVVDDQYCQTRIDTEVCCTVEKDGDTYQMLDEDRQVHTTFTIK